MEQKLNKAFEGQIAEIAEQTSRTLRAQHKYVMEQYGPRMNGIYNSREYRLADLVKSIAKWDGPDCQWAHIPESEKKVHGLSMKPNSRKKLRNTHKPVLTSGNIKSSASWKI